MFSAAGIMNVLPPATDMGTDSVRAAAIYVVDISSITGPPLSFVGYATLLWRVFAPKAVFVLVVSKPLGQSVQRSASSNGAGGG